MPLVYVVSREPRLRSTVAEYLRGRGYDTRTGANYDEAMETLPGLDADALVVDIQGVPRGETGASFAVFGHWLAAHRDGTRPAVVYLLRKGARRPSLRVEGPIIKKPFPLEALGEALREQLGASSARPDRRGIDLDLTTNTVRGPQGAVHLTNLEANLLAYLMQHEGQVLHPRDLLVDVWQFRDATGASTLVRAHVSNLRRKLRAAGTPDCIQTIRGKGYRFSA
ncbi:Response regulator MprA [bacterium HR29]|jgi:DNA-binding response OmpR family regulator|nr:Response regulator MprA [bacterium HR29]